MAVTMRPTRQAAGIQRLIGPRCSEARTLWTVITIVSSHAGAGSEPASKSLPTAAIDRPTGWKFLVACQIHWLQWKLRTAEPVAGRPQLSMDFLHKRANWTRKTRWRNSDGYGLLQTAAGSPTRHENDSPAAARNLLVVCANNLLPVEFVTLACQSHFQIEGRNALPPSAPRSALQGDPLYCTRRCLLGVYDS
jgi:hypothetical protein